MKAIFFLQCMEGKILARSQVGMETTADMLIIQQETEKIVWHT